MTSKVEQWLNLISHHRVFRLGFSSIVYIHSVSKQHEATPVILLGLPVGTIITPFEIDLVYITPVERPLFYIHHTSGRAAFQELFK